jgi:hypothetical protein
VAVQAICFPNPTKAVKSMRKFPFSAIVLPLFFAVSAPSSATQCDDRRLAAMQQFTQNAAKVYDNTVTSPDPLSIENCIGSLSSFGSLKFPDLTNLGQDALKQLCQAVKSQVSSATSGMQYNFQLGQFGTVGVGQGGGTSSTSSSSTSLSSTSLSSTSLSSTSLGSVPITITPAPTDPAASTQSQGQTNPLLNQIMSIIQ